MGKTINLLTAAADSDTTNNNNLLAIADPITGIATKMTIAQAKAAFGTRNYKYVATGTEGTTITISALAGMEIVMITRESGIIYEVSSSPDSTEFTWDSTNIVLGLATNPSERFNILYRNA